MKWTNPFNKTLASLVVALSLATNLPAGMDQKNDTYTKRTEKDCFAFCYPKDMNLINPADIYFYVAGLAMQASQGGLEWGIQNNNGTSLPITGGEVFNFEWNYNPGVRVALGGYINHDAWQLEANWTWVHFSNPQTSSTGTGKIIPTFLSGGDSATANAGTFANAGWHGQYNVVDTWMGKPYYVSRNFIINPMLGLRIGLIDQEFHVKYNGSTAAAYFDGKNNFIGLGLRTGMNTDWIVDKNWRFFGTFAASMIRGHYAVNQTYTDAATPTLGGSGLNEHFWDNAPVLELAFGLQWGMHFNSDSNYVALRAAYEFHEWFNQLQIRKIYAGGTTGGTNGIGNEALRTNFSLNGFSLSLQFDF